MKADYVEIDGQFYSKYHPKVVNRGILRPNPPAGIRAEKPESDRGKEGQNSGMECGQESVCFRVTIIVRRPRLLDDGDNDRAALKPIRDFVARICGLSNDKPPGIIFDYQQIKSKSRSTTVIIDTLTPSQVK